MAVPVKGQVGPQTLQDGYLPTIRLGRTAEQIVTELHGKYYEANYRGGLFTATAAMGTLQTGPSTSMAPLGLFNPANSGKNLVLVRVLMALGTSAGTQVAGAFDYYVVTNPSAGAPTGTTAATIIPGIVGSNAQPVGKAYSAGTLAATPTLFLPFAGKPGTSASSSVQRQVDDIDGMIILAPGTAIVVQESTADTTNNWGASLGFVWEEVPV